MAEPSLSSPSPPPHVPFVRAHFRPDAQLMQRLEALLRSGKVTNGGPATHALQRRAAERWGVSDVAAVSSGTLGLLLALRALGLCRGAAIVPAYTYAATLNAVVWAGLEPVLADIDETRLTVAPASVEALLRSRPDVVAVVAVNVFGVAPDFDALADVCAPAGATLVYDAAHASGAKTRQAALPPGVAAAAFSLHATKVWPAVEGGLVVARDTAVVERVRRLARHGLPAEPGTAFTCGLNAKMDELRATIALHTFDFLDEAVASRRRAWRRLREVVVRAGKGRLRVQGIPRGGAPNAQNFWMGVDPSASPGAAALVEQFERRGVEARRYFHPPLHRLEGPWARGAHVPVTETVWQHSVCLPLHAFMGDRAIEQVADAIAEVAAWLDRACPS